MIIYRRVFLFKIVLWFYFIHVFLIPYEAKKIV